MRKFFSDGWKAIGYVSRWIFLILLTLAVIVIIAIPVFDLRDTVVVNGPSMQPEIPIYSYVVVREAGDLKVGDIITYKSARMEKEATHRIIEVKPQFRRSVPIASTR